MEGDPPAGPQGPGPGPDPRSPDPDPRPPDPAPKAPGAEQGEQGEQGAAEEPPSSDTPRDPPAGRGDTPVEAATNAGVEGDPPPYSPSPPARKRVRFDCPPCPPSQQEPIFYQPRPGQRARPFPPQTIPPGALPYNIYTGQYTGQPSMGPLPAGYRQDLPRDYLVEAVLVTVCCCMLTGAMALIYSHETRAAIRRGDIDQAFSASRKAWCLILFSLLFGLFVSITWVICVLATLYRHRGP
ncbi:proline rich transmembrane protein 1B [Chiroxiphia lanceolata]|uniref:proline rich transmembrane protein 1B n=1 Tax=Chiroxiphia lanceolata TaxID=296741 RepID=UPI0013CF1859|nr:proline rich transmembrane protein 1B [Chiroxiphia lanceolata]